MGAHFDVFRKFRKTLTALNIFSGRDKSKLNYLVTMNIPPLMGRRDAAYERAAAILNNGNHFALSEESRGDIYRASLKMLGIAIEATAHILSLSADSSVKEERSLLQYFKLLHENIGAANALVEHELSLFHEEGELSQFIGREIANQFRVADEVFNNSEVNIYQCIVQFIDIAKLPIIRYREYAIRHFTRHNLNRYRRSFDGFREIYKDFGTNIKDKTAQTT